MSPAFRQSPTPGAGTESLRAGLPPPGSHPLGLYPSSLHHLSSVRSLHGPEHPDPGFRGSYRQHNRAPCSRSTSRRNTPCHGFHDRSRKRTRRLVRTTWHGTWISATQNVENSIRSSDRFSARCRSAHRGCSGTSSADHAFRLHARPAITMYAQLLTRPSTGIASAFTPPFNWAIRFSWSHRSSARNTTSEAGVVRSLVIQKKYRSGSNSHNCPFSTTSFLRSTTTR